MQADIKWSRHNRVKALAKHAVAVWTDHVVTDAHALRAVDALVGIAQDEAVRHINFVVVIIARLSIMEAIISQAMLDTVFLQITLSGSGTGTLQATSRFALSLLLQVAHLDNLEVTLALLEFQATGHILHIFITEEGMYRTRT